MLDVPTLDALDLMLWLQSGVQAAKVSDCVPSTIVRRVDQALKMFDLKLRRAQSGWTVRGNTQLISLEREIHQLHRFRHGGPLRLHIPAWTQQLLREELPSPWMDPPFSDGPPCGDPLSLLRHRIIDACLLTPSQLAAAGIDPAALPDDLVSVEIYRSQIRLYGTSLDPQEPMPNDLAAACQSGAVALEIPMFLPLPCREMVRQRFQSVNGGGKVPQRLSATRRKPPTWELTMLTPEMAALRPALRPLAEPLDWAYSEHLVLLRDHADRPECQRLLEHLHQHLQPVAQPSAVL